MDDDDRYISLFLFGIFWLVTFVLALGVRASLPIRIGIFLLPFLLSLIWPKLLNLISSVGTSLVYGPNLPDLSYENRYYEEDMGKALRFVREEKWNEAIVAYREIIQKAPKMCEPRFNLARIYQKEGHFGLALVQYKKILDSKDELGPDHAFVLESERAIQGLTKSIKDIGRIIAEA